MKGIFDCRDGQEHDLEVKCSLSTVEDLVATRY
jgi:hypothetical protein